MRRGLMLGIFLSLSAVGCLPTGNALGESCEESDDCESEKCWMAQCYGQSCKKDPASCPQSYSCSPFIQSDLFGDEGGECLRPCETTASGGSTCGFGYACVDGLCRGSNKAVVTLQATSLSIKGGESVTFQATAQLPYKDPKFSWQRGSSTIQETAATLLEQQGPNGVPVYGSELTLTFPVDQPGEKELTIVAIGKEHDAIYLAGTRSSATVSIHVCSQTGRSCSLSKDCCDGLSCNFGKCQ